MCRPPRLLMQCAARLTIRGALFLKGAVARVVVHETRQAGRGCIYSGIDGVLGGILHLTEHGLSLELVI